MKRGVCNSNCWRRAGRHCYGLDSGRPRRLSENTLFPKLFFILKKLSSEYQLDMCYIFFAVLDFEKNCYSWTAS